MRRVMLLALLALALPTAALASSVEFQTGNFISGTIKSTFRNPFFLEVVGSMNTIRLDTSTLGIDGGHCSATAPVCSFATGTVTVTHGTTMFTSTLMDGVLTHSIIPGFDIVNVTAVLPPSTTVGSGSRVSFTVFLSLGRNHSLIDPSMGTVLVTSPIPEPSTLGLLGTGLIGLAGMARRRLNLWM